jgi:hypothetical protein
VRGWLRVSALCGAALAVASLLSGNTAQAQTFIWGGAGSTTNTAVYNSATNWSNPPAGAPPVAAGQSAVFGATGGSFILNEASAIAPDSWTFTANSQSYSIFPGGGRERPELQSSGAHGRHH